MVHMAPRNMKPADVPEPDESELEEVALGNIPDRDMWMRSNDAGYTSTNIGCVDVLVRGSEERRLGSFCSWAVVKQDKRAGIIYLVPCLETNPNRIAVRWVDAHRAAVFSLRKFFKAKDYKIPHRHTWLVPCSEAKLKDGPALEMRFKEATEEPIESTPASTPHPAPHPPTAG